MIMFKLDVGVAIAILIAAGQRGGVPTTVARDGKSIGYQVDSVSPCEYEWIEAVIHEDGSIDFYGSK